MLCSLVKEAHEKQAWRALGYATWAAYCKAEFNIGKSRSYQLVKYAEVIALGSDTSGLPESTIVDSLPEGRARGLDRAELADMLEDAYESLPEDATINTRRELFDAVLAQLTGDQGEPSDVDDKDDGSSSPSEPQQPPPAAAPDPGNAGADTPSDAAATGCTDADIPASGAEGGGVTEPATVTPPTLPTLPSLARALAVAEESAPRCVTLADQNAESFLRLDPAEVAGSLTDTTREIVCAHLDDLADWLHRFDQAMKEQNA